MTFAAAGQEDRISAQAFDVAEMIWRAIGSDSAILRELEGSEGEQKGGENTRLTKDTVAIAVERGVEPQ